MNERADTHGVDAGYGSQGLLRARLKTRQLLLLTALDDARSLHGAAQALCVTQPAASKQLKDLEDLLEVKLFERHSRGMRPTRFGEMMIRHARAALTTLSAAQDDLLALRSGLSGQVEVGAIMTPAMGLLPLAIARIKRRAPLLRVGVHVESSKVLLQMLRRGALDFMIGRLLDDDAPGDLHYEELAIEPVCAVARVGHPLARITPLRLADLAAQPWVLPPPGSVLRQRWTLMFQRVGLAPPADVVDTTALMLITALLQQTDALHVMPIEVARYYESLAVLAVLPIELPCQMDAFGIIQRRGHVLAAGAQQLLSQLRVASVEFG